MDERELLHLIKKVEEITSKLERVERKIDEVTLPDRILIYVCSRETDEEEAFYLIHTYLPKREAPISNAYAKADVDSHYIALLGLYTAMDTVSTLFKNDQVEIFLETEELVRDVSEGGISDELLEDVRNLIKNSNHKISLFLADPEDVKYQKISEEIDLRIRHASSDR